MRTQQGKAAVRECLRFFAPSDVVALQRLDALGVLVLHALEDDQPAARRFDTVVENAEQMTDAAKLLIENKIQEFGISCLRS